MANRFASLMDEEPQLEEESEEETTTIINSTSSLPIPGSSKKAKARQRMAERKRLAASSREDLKAEREIIPAVPSLPLQYMNGAQGEVIKAIEESIPAVEEVDVVELREEIEIQSDAPSAPVTESASSSDDETIGDYPSDDDEEDLFSPTPGPTLLISEVPDLPLPPPAVIITRKPSIAQIVTPPTEVYTGADHDPNKKLGAIITRTVYGLLMAVGLITIVCVGQIYVIALVFVCQAVVYSELAGLFDAGYSNHGEEVLLNVQETEKERIRELRRKGRRAERDRWSRRISWYFFAATNYFLYGESLIYYFKHILTLQASFLPATFSFAQHHRLISFGLYVIGFISFVANLQRAQLRRQFGLFGWIHMSLLLVVVSSHFIVNNILEGLIWFWVPASLVIMNDIAAYVCGMAFGRHQLIKLSPKKTVEGFVGAFFVTIVFAYIWGTLFMRFDYMICPVRDLATNVLSNATCSRNQVFIWREYPLPPEAVAILKTITRTTITKFSWAPFQLHSIVLAIFASLVAPFGGFFASGFKRAFNIKDFGASIPGHGGLTDRMDCQFLMGLFTYVWYASLVRESRVTVAGVMATIVGALSLGEQQELLIELQKALGRN